MSWTKTIQSTPSLFVRATAISLAIFSLWFVIGVSNAKAQAFSEGFEVVPVPGWTMQNNSIPIGTVPTWFQGNTGVFPAHMGPPTAYIGANFNNTTGANTISNWLITPQRTFNNGDIIRFWTRTTTGNPFPDRLQVRRSSAGASTNVGTGPTAVGDFTTLLLDINPTYQTGGVYPEVWTQFTITLSGLAAPTSGRIAFRYFVEDGGPAGDNSNYIGIDTFSYTPAGPPMATGDAPVDFNGDGRTDFAVVRNVGGGPTGQLRWFYNLNTTTPSPATVALDWGLASDFIVSEDFDGDDRDDVTVWRPGAATVAAFYILQSQTNTVRVEAFGQTGDDPTIVDDYNGDNRADLAVYRPGANATWFYRTAVNGPVTFIRWGQTGDFVAPGDYDGNGSADFGVQRPAGGQAQFWIRLSTGVIQPVVTFGLSSDLVVPGDWDGDSKTDIATARAVSGSRQWQYLSSLNGSINYITFGRSTDFVAQGDYDGDGRTDAAVYQTSATANQSAFYARSTASAAVTIFAIGATGDYPTANFNTH